MNVITLHPLNKGIWGKEEYTFYGDKENKNPPVKRIGFEIRPESRLVDRWYVAAVTGKISTQEKTVLIKDTHAVAYKLLSLKKQEKIGEAKLIVDNITDRFFLKKEEDSKLIDFINHNSPSKNSGAYIALQHLFAAICQIKKLPANKSTQLFAAVGLINQPVKTQLGYISQSAFRKIEGQQAPFFKNPNIREHIFAHMNSQSQNNFAMTSKKNQKDVYRFSTVPLRKRNIRSADEAIEFVKKFGKGLKYIDISNIIFSETEIKELLNNLPDLKTLIAESCFFENTSEEVLKHLSPFKYLKSLNLSYCEGITDEGLKHLSSFKYLKSLNLRGCRKVTDEGLRHLSSLINLEFVSLENCPKITDEGLIHLSSLIHLKLVTLHDPFALEVND